MKNDLKEYRKFLGLTQQELAKKIGVSRVTIISIESGRYTPRLPLAYRIAEAFNVPIYSIFPKPAKGETIF